MDLDLTIKMLTNIGAEIIKTAKENDNCNQLLDEEIYNRVDTILIKKKLLALFKKFNSLKYLLQIPFEDNIKITSNYDHNLSSSTNTKVSKVENLVSKSLDNKMFLKSVYNMLLSIGHKLTEYESIYLVNTFLYYHSEENIAENMRISKTYLQKIKKSCIVKIWIDLNIFCEGE